jgi:hypothetical protein
MKTYRGSRGVAPYIFNIDSRWSWIVRFAFRLLYTAERERALGTNWIGDCLYPRARLGVFCNKDKCFVPAKILTRLVQPSKINEKCAILLVVKFVSSEMASGAAGFHDALKIHVSAFPARSRGTCYGHVGSWYVGEFRRGRASMRFTATLFARGDLAWNIHVEFCRNILPLQVVAGSSIKVCND